MTPIKFRGKVDGQWWYATLESNGDAGNFEQLLAIADRSTIGQFTTRLDKDGKEIYVGDICMVIRTHTAFNGDKVEVPEGPYTVYWNDDRWGLKDQLGMDYDNGDYYNGDIINWNEHKVVGNIYDKEMK